MGCIYDHLAVDWPAPHCVDGDLVRELDRSGPDPNGSWPYFEFDVSSLRFQRLEAADVDRFAREGRDYWTTRGWHVAHCLFTWRKQFRAGFGADGERDVESWNQREGHVVHCSRYVLQAVREGREGAEIDTLIRGSERHTREMADALIEVEVFVYLLAYT